MVMLLLITAFFIIQSLGAGCHRCSSGDCSPRVCWSPGSCGQSCVDCNTKSDCGWAAGRPYCLARSCVQCVSTPQCVSDRNCDISCDSNRCAQHSVLDCTALPSTPRCLVGSNRCVQCLGDSDCSSNQNKSYCNPNTLTCEECWNDYQCRSSSNCNAVCTVLNTTSAGIGAICRSAEEPMDCESKSKSCYPWLGVCHESCNSTSGCPPENTTLGSYCNNGVCYPCLSNEHCYTNANLTCGSKCQQQFGGNQVCSSVSGCKSRQNCVYGYSISFSGPGYFCSGVIEIIPSFVLLLGLLILLI